MWNQILNHVSSLLTTRQMNDTLILQCSMSFYGLLFLYFQVEWFLNLLLIASTLHCWRNIVYLILEERGYWGDYPGVADVC